MCESLSFKEQAKIVVDMFIKNGLDCNAVVCKNMEKSIEIKLKEIHRDVRHHAAETVIDTELDIEHKKQRMITLLTQDYLVEKAKYTVDLFVENDDLDCGAVMHRNLENILVTVYESVMADSISSVMKTALKYDYQSSSHNEIMNLT